MINTIVAIVVFLTLTPCVGLGFDIVSNVEITAGYDDNINEKESSKKTESAFISAIPEISIYGTPSEGFTASAGYQFTYTQYFSNALENMILHEGWGRLTRRLRPRLFFNAETSVEVLENQEDPDDNGWGFTVSPGISYHVSEKLSLRTVALYTRWKYDNLNFDTGRAYIRLDEPQVDNRYSIEAGLTYLLFLSGNLDFAYWYTYNESNNEIDEYSVNSVLARFRFAITGDLNLTVGYEFGKRNYFNWRAGKQLRGKLRDDYRHRYWLNALYSATPYLDLVFSYEGVWNDSNLSYESFTRNLVYGGVLLNWDWPVR